jgi:predicted AlkP superfamily phosphohydrolase/phosphomutase
MVLAAAKTRKKALPALVVTLGLALAVVLLAPAPAQAYVGPGAGFAFLSSFLVLVVAFFSSLFSLITFPVRALYWAWKRRKVLTRAKVKRVVIVGLDGMDPELATRYMNEGKLPHFARLREQGTFMRLQTTYPAISPVAWSSFQTGVNPGQHNIYDFLTRDPNTYFPLLSSAEIHGPRRKLRLGKHVIPIGRPRTKLLRKSTPFWHYLGKVGIFCSVLRVPITFPPEKSRGLLLSGMCVPDLLGSQGTFSFYTTRVEDSRARQGGQCIPVEKEPDGFRSYVPGPDYEVADGTASSRVPFRLRRLNQDGQAQIKIGDERFRLRTGEYSDWIQLKFRVGPGIKVYGISRFFLKSVSPHLELYVSPVNIDPAKPALPISHPPAYSIYLAKLQGPFATLGLAEDTWALNEGVLDDDAFLQQCYLNHDEREKMFFDALEKTRQGLCACVFDTTDRVQHMFWRQLEPDHPANRPDGRGSPRNGNRSSRTDVIEDLYRRMDNLVGRTRAQMDKNAVLLVVSDHGFTSFRRGINLNSWLHQNGYLALKTGSNEGRPDGRGSPRDWFKDVDWTRTRAYALGLGGLYLNQKNREGQGVVEPGAEADSLRKELRARLRGLRDPENNKVAISDVIDSRAVFAGPYRGNAPDLIIGYNKGYRAAWEGVTGTVTGTVFEDNTRPWSGDHCVDPAQVPGVLFSSHRLDCERPAIIDIAPTVLDFFGLTPPHYMNGRPWALAREGDQR